MKVTRQQQISLVSGGHGTGFIRDVGGARASFSVSARMASATATLRSGRNPICTVIGANTSLAAGERVSCIAIACVP